MRILEVQEHVTQELPYVFSFNRPSLPCSLELDERPFNNDVSVGSPYKRAARKGRIHDHGFAKRALPPSVETAGKIAKVL